MGSGSVVLFKCTILAGFVVMDWSTLDNTSTQLFIPVRLHISFQILRFLAVNEFLCGLVAFWPGRLDVPTFALI